MATSADSLNGTVSEVNVPHELSEAEINQILLKPFLAAAFLVASALSLGAASGLHSLLEIGVALFVMLPIGVFGSAQLLRSRSRTTNRAVSTIDRDPETTADRIEIATRPHIDLDDRRPADSELRAPAFAGW